MESKSIQPALEKAELSEIAILPQGKGKASQSEQLLDRDRFVALVRFCFQASIREAMLPKPAHVLTRAGCVSECHWWR